MTLESVSRLMYAAFVKPGPFATFPGSTLAANRSETGQHGNSDFIFSIRSPTHPILFSRRSRCRRPFFAECQWAPPAPKECLFFLLRLSQAGGSPRSPAGTTPLNVRGGRTGRVYCIDLHCVAVSLSIGFGLFGVASFQGCWIPFVSRM